MTIFDEIDNLTREQVLEAAQFVGETIAGSAEGEMAARNALGDIAIAPYQHLGEVEELARLVLRAAADVPEYEPAVRAALDGIGRKQIILGGAEIIALSVVGLLALKLLVNKGKTEESTENVIEIDAEGKTVMRAKHNVTYETGSSLADVLMRFFGR